MPGGRAQFCDASWWLLGLVLDSIGFWRVDSLGVSTCCPFEFGKYLATKQVDKTQVKSIWCFSKFKNFTRREALLQRWTVKVLWVFWLIWGSMLEPTKPTLFFNGVQEGVLENICTFCGCQNGRPWETKTRISHYKCCKTSIFWELWNIKNIVVKRVPVNDQHQS